MSDDNLLFEASGLHKTFHETGTEIVVLRNVDFSLQSGDFVSITGASGAGKSTLLHVLGLLDKPSSGKIKIAQQDVSQLSDRQLSEFRNQYLGFVFQFHHLLPDFTALENILMPACINRKPTTNDKVRANELAQRIGIEHRLNHLPSEISGGERQRVALARALMNQPKILLCDEPSGNLDQKNSEKLNLLLAELCDSLSIALVVVTHEEPLAQMAKRQYHLQDCQLLPKT